MRHGIKPAAGAAALLALTVCPGTAEPQTTQRVRAPEPAVVGTMQSNASTAKLGWQRAGRSRGNRPIRAMHCGDGNFRVLIVGSLSGNDPRSLAVVDELAAHLEQNTGIVGGFHAVLVRSPNPDGGALNRSTNASGVRIETAFPPASSKASESEPEVQLLVRLTREFRPDRVIHITSCPGKTPLVLHNRTSSAMARDLAEWLSAESKPNARFAPRRSMEHYLGESAEVLTLLIPTTTQPDSVWETWGDSLLACLVPPIDAPVDEWPPPTAARPVTPRVFPSGDSKARPRRHPEVEVLPPPPRRQGKSR